MGIVVQRGYLPPPNLMDERIQQVTDGYIYQAISNGIRNMPAYGKQIPEADRWAIVSYIRVLQREFIAQTTQNAASDSASGN